MASPEHPDWIGPAIGGVATVLAGWLSWWAATFTATKNAEAAKPDPQAEINDGFTALLAGMRQELKAASRERNHLNQVLEEERRAWRVEREAWRIEREAFLGRINQLQAVAEGFERLLRRHGVPLPERKTYVSEALDHQPAQMVETTLRQDDMGDAD